MALFTDYTILKQHCESRHPLIYDCVVFDPRAEAIMFERPSTLLLSKLTSVTNFLPSFVASWVAYFTGVAVYAMSMLAEVFRGAHFTDCFQTSVLANASAATLFTYAAYTSMRAFIAFAFGSRTRIAFQTRFEPFTEPVHLEAVGEETLAASGTLNGIVHLSALVCIYQ